MARLHCMGTGGQDQKHHSGKGGGFFLLASLVASFPLFSSDQTVFMVGQLPLSLL